LSIYLLNIDRFSQFFHRRTQLEICNKIINKDPRAHLGGVATLPCEMLMFANRKLKLKLKNISQLISHCCAVVIPERRDSYKFKRFQKISAVVGRAAVNDTALLATAAGRMCSRITSV